MKVRSFLVFLLVQLHGGLVGADWARDQVGMNGPLDCSGAVIALFDSGVQLNHELLKNQFWINENEIPANGIDDDRNGYVDDVHGYDFFDGDGDPSETQLGHGTQLTLLLAAHGPLPRSDAFGLCERARIMVLRISDSQGRFDLKSITRATDYAIRMGANIIHNSNGLILQFGFPPQRFKRAMRSAHRAGLLWVQSASNLSIVSRGGTTNLEHHDSAIRALFPDNHGPMPGKLGVGGSEQRDIPWLGGLSHPKAVDIMAPADQVAIAVSSQEVKLINGNSPAAVFITAAAAFLKTKDGKMTMDDIRLRLIQSAHKSEAYRYESAHGRLDLNSLHREEQNEWAQYEWLGSREIYLETGRPHPTGQNLEWILTEPGAEFMRVVFTYMDLSGCWRALPFHTYVTIEDPQGTIYDMFSCTTFAKQQRLPSKSVPGDQLVIRLHSGGGSAGFHAGFIVRELQWGRRISP